MTSRFMLVEDIVTGVQLGVISTFIVLQAASVIAAKGTALRVKSMMLKRLIRPFVLPVMAADILMNIIDPTTAWWIRALDPLLFLIWIQIVKSDEKSDDDDDDPWLKLGRKIKSLFTVRRLSPVATHH